MVVEQTTEQRRQPQTVVLKIKGDKYRKDFPNGTSAIYDLSTGDTIRIDHAAKTFRKLSGKEVREALADNQQKSGQPPPKPPKITDTGTSGKVDGHDAEIYTASAAGAIFTYWVAKDYPDMAAVSAEMKKFRDKSDAFSKANNIPVDPSQIDGIILKSESLSAGGGATTITLLSAKVQVVDDSEFVVPEGYKEVVPPPARPIPRAATQ